MRKHTVIRVTVVLGLLLAVLPTAAGAAPVAAPAIGQGSIDQFVLDQIAANGKANVFVKLAADADLRSNGRACLSPSRYLRAPRIGDRSKCSFTVTAQ